MRRIFADSSVLIAGVGSRQGASRAMLVMAEIGLFKLIVSRQVLAECERNLRKKLPRTLPIFAELLTAIELEIVPDPSLAESQKWEPIIEAKDAPILAAAIEAKAERLLSLNTKDFTAEVARQSGLIIQTPDEFIQAIREIINREL